METKENAQLKVSENTRTVLCEPAGTGAYKLFPVLKTKYRAGNPGLASQHLFEERN